MRKLFSDKPFATIAGILIVCFASMLVVNACRKIDYQPTISENLLEQKFFYSRVSSVPVVKEVTGFVYRQNQKYNFLQNLVNRIGFPYWNKALSFSGSIEYARGNGDSDSADIVYVPFVRESDNFVNATLIVKLTETDTAFKILCDYQYDDFGFEEVDRGEWNAWHVFQIFATLDSQVFNRKNFQIIDERLLIEEGKDSLESKDLAFDSVQIIYSFGNAQFGGSGRSAFYMPVEVCSPMSMCLVANTGGGCNTGGGGGSPARGAGTYSHGSCCVYINWSVCWYVWVDYGEDPGGGGGSPGGGGTPGGGWDPPPCSEGSGRFLVVNPCGGGWIPIEDEPLPPILPPSDSLIAENLKRLYQKAQNWPDSLHNKAQQDGDERTFTFNRAANGDTVAVYALRGTSHTSQPNLFFNSLGIFHTHQEDDTTAVFYKNECFDGPDIYKLYKNNFIDGYPIVVSFVSTRDFIYAAIITDKIKFGNYIRNLCGSSNLSVIDHRLDSLHANAMKNCNTMPQCNYQKKTELGVLAITANNNSSTSGIKIFRSPRQNINFTLLTQ